MSTILFKKGLHTTYRNAVGKHFSRKAFEKLNQPQFPVPGSILINGIPFAYHDARCFYDTYKEIFVRNMYQFTTAKPKPYIIDCGANMGVSVLYFALKYPTATIEAFEPEEGIFKILEKNTRQFNLHNVHLHQTAVWVNNTPLQFYTDTGMGGSVTNVYSNQQPTLIQTEILANYLQQPVDMLKLDIEGAEVEVIQHCAHLLHHVQHLFVEYHSFIHQEQHLNTLLNILKNAGYRYHLSQSFSRVRPFVDATLACENMDMAINIFAYRS